MITQEVRSPGDAVATPPFSIKKTYDKELPFIGDDKSSLFMEPEAYAQGWIGVRCDHSELILSPHLVGSHVESAAHVIGDAKHIRDVLSDPFYRRPIQALHVQLEAEPLQITQIESLHHVVRFIFANNETYTLKHKEKFLELPTEYIVTSQMLSKAIGDCKEEAILICMKGHETSIHNWPYLTNDAVRLLIDKGIRLIGLNVPSFDREQDGGLTSNHKLFFEDQDRLIVESLALEPAPTGKVLFSLKPDYSGECIDTFSCDPTITPN